MMLEIQSTTKQEVTGVLEYDPDYGGWCVWYDNNYWNVNDWLSCFADTEVTISIVSKKTVHVN